MMKQLRIIAVVLLVSLVAMICLSCAANTTTKTTTGTTGTTTTPAATTTTDADKPLTEIKLPIVTTPTTLSVFVNLNTAELSYYANLAETPPAKEIMKRTGITLEFVHPPAGQGNEQFNLMVAGRELTDIVAGYFYDVYKGGVKAAIEDKLIIDPAPLVEKYAPNFKRMVLDHDVARKIVIDDEGTMTGFGCSFGMDLEIGTGHNYVGPMVRKDLLEQSGLPLPETMDDWYVLLNKFKEMGVKIPFTWGHNGKDWDPMLGSFVFAAAYDTAFNHGTQRGFINNNNTVAYGPINDGYKQMLTMFNKWYSESLLNKDFPTQTYLEHVKYQSSTGEAGAAVHHLFEYGTIAPEMDKNGFSMIPAPQPVLYKGQKLHYNSEGGWWVSASGRYITTQCKTPEVAVQWLDWMYTEEARMITNWGIEGESYNIVNGKPQFTESFLADRVRMNMTYAPNALKLNLDSTMDDEQYNLPVQREAWALWGDPSYYSATPNYRFKQGISFTSEENTRFTELMTEIRTYVEEMFMKFILGLEPLSNYDAYVSKVKELGIEEARTIYQQSLDRYNAR